MKRRPPTTRWLKDIATWKIGKTLYISVVFSWDVERSVEIAAKHNGPVIVGGPAAILNQGAFEGVAKVQEECDVCEPVLFHNPLASFSTRGCPNKCPFCAVPKIEGDFREIENFRPAPVMCDNNFLAASKKHQERVVDSLLQYDIVDFDQGLDARLFTPEAAGNLGRLKRLHLVFAFDHIGSESYVADAVALAKKTIKTEAPTIYVLYGFHDTLDETLYRLEKVLEWGFFPAPLRYQPLDAKHRNGYVDANWTELLLKKVAKYYFQARYTLRYDNGVAWTKNRIPFNEYDFQKHTDERRLF